MVFIFLFLTPTPGNLQESAFYLSPPGLRTIKDPTIIIPTTNKYRNQPPAIPEYRNESGKTVRGWAKKYIDTRRFSSDGSAWIYYRISDLANSKTTESEWSHMPLRIWPVGTTIVLESYKGNAAERKPTGLEEIVVMHKDRWPDNASSKSYHPTNWYYGRFTPQGDLLNTPDKVAECHQCHSIAFRLTGDLIFTQFP